jgi:hypothetical protein
VRSKTTDDAQIFVYTPEKRLLDGRVVPVDSKLFHLFLAERLPVGTDVAIELGGIRTLSGRISSVTVDGGAFRAEFELQQSMDVILVDEGRRSRKPASDVAPGFFKFKFRIQRSSAAPRKSVVAG